MTLDPVEQTDIAVRPTVARYADHSHHPTGGVEPLFEVNSRESNMNRVDFVLIMPASGDYLLHQSRGWWSTNWRQPYGYEYDMSMYAAAWTPDGG